MLPANCFEKEVTLASSCYLAFRDNQLVDALRVHSAAEVPEPARVAHDLLRAMVLDPKYPCVGAQCVLKSGGYRLGWYGSLGTEDATAGLFHGLSSFVREQPTIGTKFSSFIAMFESPDETAEVEFERLLWQQLQMLHNLDSQSHDWDSTVSNDPADPRFAFSVAGLGFFIIGLHAGSSRTDRRFVYPTLIFNAQFMFDRLRTEKKFHAMARTVRERTLRIGLDINPSLTSFGEGSAAPQYAGRQVEPDWVCPLNVRGR